MIKWVCVVLSYQECSIWYRSNNKLIYSLTKKEGGCQAPFTSVSKPDPLQRTHLALSPQPLSSDSLRARETNACTAGIFVWCIFLFLIERIDFEERTDMEQRSIELKTNTSASCVVSCFLTTANQYRQTRYKTSQYRFKNQGAPSERLKDSVSGLWNLGWRSCLRVDPWVPSTIHFFNKIGTGECRLVQW